MGFLDHVRLWRDVSDPRLDEKAAPSLGAVHLGREEVVYSDPVEFFRRTLVTKQMVEALENVADALAGRGGNKLTMLLSLFGGGKTHTLLTIYHALRKPAALLEAKAEDEETAGRLRKLAEELAALGGVRVVVLDGYFSELAPSPANPLVVPGGYRVQTLWGSLAHQLGRFGEVRVNDEKLLAPPADVLLKVIGEEPVLILVDEIADYTVRLHTSGDPQHRDYAGQVISFLEMLVKAVDMSRRSVLVISLPVEERREGPQVEERYKSSLDVVTSLYKSASRVVARRIVPVAPSDVPSILKVRIFESVDQRAARALASTLAKLYTAEENREVFGEGAYREAQRAEKTYPFHPSYIDTLVDILDKHEGLEKTRDALRITRKVVRRLAKAGSKAELIMPFHIDLGDPEIKGLLFSHELYRQYAMIVEEDVLEKTRGYEKPEVARAVAATILLQSFFYGGSLRYHQLYPDGHRVLVSSFEPTMAQAFNLQPKDYLDALEWASGNLTYLVSEGRRYWFIQIASPIRMVEMRAKEVGDYEAVKKVVEYAQKLLTKPSEEVVSGSRRRGRVEEVARTPFNAAMCMVLTEPRPVDHDSADYLLLVVLSPVRREEAERVIYERPSGGSRRYANTVYLVHPRDSSSLSQMLGFAKLLLACEEVEREIDSLYESSEIRDVMKRKLEQYGWGMAGVEGKLVTNILAGLNSIAYPSFDEQSRRNTVNFADVKSVSDTIIGTATRTLQSIKPEKFYEELDFDTLDYLLSQIGIKLSEGDSPRPLSSIEEYFYSNPRLPMVRRDAVKGALTEGVRRLEIGVKKGDRVYFKRVHECMSRQECSPPSVEEGEAPISMEPGDLVLPWRLALQEQLEGLRDREERVAGGVRRTWHAFFIEGQLVPVAEALKSRDLGTLRYSPLARVTEFLEEGVDVKLERYEVEALPGGEFAVGVLVERIGSFKGELVLSASAGSLTSTSVTIGDERPSAELVWSLKAPEEPGGYVYELKVAVPSGEVLKSAKLTVVVSSRERGAVRGIPPRGSRLSAVEIEVPVFNFKPLRVLESKFGTICEVEEAMLSIEAEAGGKKPRVEVRLSSVTFDDLRSIFMAAAQRYGGLLVRSARYRIRLRPRAGDSITAPGFTEDEARDVGDYMTYYTFGEGGA